MEMHGETFQNPTVYDRSLLHIERKSKYERRNQNKTESFGICYIYTHYW